MSQIKAQLPEAERERTWARLMLLLCETEDTIFNHDEFKGEIEAVAPQRFFTQIERDKPSLSDDDNKSVKKMIKA